MPKFESISSLTPKSTSTLTISTGGGGSGWLRYSFEVESELSHTSPPSTLPLTQFRFRPTTRKIISRRVYPAAVMHSYFLLFLLLLAPLVASKLASGNGPTPGSYLYRAMEQRERRRGGGARAPALGSVSSAPKGEPAARPVVVRPTSSRWQFLGKIPVKVVGGGVAVGVVIKVAQLLVTGFEEWRRGRGRGSSGSGSGSSSASAVMRDLDSTASLVDILASSGDGLRAANSTSAVDSAAELEGNYVVLIFDCESKLDDAADKSARLDYFSLMANLTRGVNSTAVQMKTIYVPGKGNKSIMDTSAGTIKGLSDWMYLSSSSKSGMAAARAIREKYSVKEEELRIVVLSGDENHAVISENALDLLRINPRGMPWKPIAIQSILGIEGAPLLAAAGSNTTQLLPPSKPVAYYFSASWCKPCKTFSPILSASYNNVNATTLKFGGYEVVFVSLDAEEEAFHSYRSTFPFPAIPFQDPRRALLQMALSVKSIPALVLVDEEGKIVTSSGVSCLMADEKMANFPWANDVIDLGMGSLVESLQRGPACIALTESLSKDGQQEVRKTFAQVSKASKRPVMLPRSPRDDLVFCVLETGGKLSDALRSLCNLPATGSHTVIIDLSSEEYSVMEEQPLSGDSLAAFERAYKNYSVKMRKVVISAAE